MAHSPLAQVVNRKEVQNIWTDQQADDGERGPFGSARSHKPAISKLERQLQALDVTFELHDIQIEPTEIAPVVPHKAIRLLPFGHMSRVMLRAMRKHGAWVPTTVLAIEVCACMPDGGQSYDETYIRRAVRRRLRTLLREGRVERLLDNALSHDGLSEALWRIPPE